MAFLVIVVGDLYRSVNFLRTTTLEDILIPLNSLINCKSHFSIVVFVHIVNVVLIYMLFSIFLMIGANSQFIFNEAFMCICKLFFSPFVLGGFGDNAIVIDVFAII